MRSQHFVRNWRFRFLLLLLTIVALADVCAQTNASPSPYLFIWARSADTAQPNFLAVIDALPSSPSYGQVVSSVSVNVPTNLAHHTDYEMPAGGILFANDYSSGLSFRFDLRDPISPKLLGTFASAGPYNHAHSFVHLANGHVLATYQMKGFLNHNPGALVELDADGKVIRFSDAADPAVDPFIRPYSLAVVPALDRVVTTSADMYGAGKSNVVQIWRLSDLKRVKTVRLPEGPRGVEGVNASEPRLLADARTVLVSTEHCGIYRINRLDTDDPSAELVYDSGADTACSVPALSGHYWFQTVSHGKPHRSLLDLDGHPQTAVNGADEHSHGGEPSTSNNEWHAIVALDVSDPSHPVEVDRLSLGEFDYPHWLSADPQGNRLVMTGFEAMQNQVVILNVAPDGKLTIDSRFHSAAAGQEPGIRMEAGHWPHGGSGLAVPHGAVFSRP